MKFRMVHIFENNELHFLKLNDLKLPFISLPKCNYFSFLFLDEHLPLADLFKVKKSGIFGVFYFQLLIFHRFINHEDMTFNA
jgi:hypothetical protein